MGRVGEREMQEGREMGTYCICITDSLCYKADVIKKKIKNRSAICNFTSGYFSEENKNINLKNIYITPFIAVLFTIAKIWKQPKCLSIDD